MIRTRYSPTLIARSAQNMRSRMTTAQGLLWTRLSQGSDGVWFRRQYPIGNHIVDFYCRKLKLVVEIGNCVAPKQNERCRDLHIHDASRRDAYLRTCGYTVLRFSEQEIIHDFPSAISRIRSCVRIIRTKMQISSFMGFFRGAVEAIRSSLSPRRRLRAEPRHDLSLLVEF
jgi:very-short-patch-repair endonuclease